MNIGIVTEHLISLIDKQIQLTDRVYPGGDENARTEANVFGVITRYFNYASAASFLAAVILMVLFVYHNIK